jgi:hypothetical protein
MELARKAHVDAVGALVHAMESAGGSERPALRDALRVALEQAGDKAVPALATAGKPVALRAVLALALSALPARRSEALGIAEATAAEAREFPDRYRLAQAAAALPPSAALDAWLAATAKSAEEWMLRDAALAALARSAAPNATETARAALADPYPRVRATALGVLAASPEGFELLAKASRDDKWFLVRIGALENLPVAPGSDAVLTAALADHTAVVRASAIRNARRLRVATAWSAIEPHVARADEYPEVIGEGVGFAKALCVQSSVTALQAVARRGLVPEAWAPDQELALAALDALVQLGGDAARWAGDQARSPLVPEPVRAAIAKRIAAGTPCQPE